MALWPPNPNEFDSTGPRRGRGDPEMTSRAIFGIGPLVVGGGRGDTVPQGQDRCHGLHRPGLSAMQAAAARVGAPLGHDFCVISLSDQLKPWEAIERRLDAAGAADLALALYNPASSTRREQLARAREVLRRHRSPDTPVVVARAVGAPEESVRSRRSAGSTSTRSTCARC